MKADYQSVFTKLKVLNQWANLVNYDQTWDHKGYISTTFGEYSYDSECSAYLLFDIWSNIHYGYIERRLGKFGDADVFSALDAPRYQLAINIGIKLWDQHQLHISTALLMERIRANISGLVE